MYLTSISITQRTCFLLSQQICVNSFGSRRFILCGSRLHEYMHIVIKYQRHRRSMFGVLIYEGAACGRNVHFIACPPEVVRLIAECAWRSLLFFGCCRWPQCIGELAGAQCALVPRTRAVDTTSMDRYPCGMLHLFAAAAVRVMNACVRFSCMARKLCWRLGSRCRWKKSWT